MGDRCAVHGSTNCCSSHTSHDLLLIHAKLVAPLLVQDCGHAPAEDLALFDHRQRSEHQLPTADRVVLAYDERMTLHSEGPFSSHPERPDRIRAVMARLHACGLTDRCQPMPVREATAEEVAACHGPEHMARVEKKSALAAAEVLAGGTGRMHFSPDTYVNQHTLLCARLSAGACADVATAVVRSVKYRVHQDYVAFECMNSKHISVV